MPGFVIGALVSGVVAGVPAAIGMFGFSAASFFSAFGRAAAATLILGGLGRALAKKPTLPDAPTPVVFAARGRDLTVRQPVSPWQVVIGERRVGGVLTFAHLSADKRHFHIVITFACHACEALGDVWLNDEVVTPAMLDAAGNVTSGRYARTDNTARSTAAVVSGNTVTLPLAPVSVDLIMGYTYADPNAPAERVPAGDYTLSGTTLTFASRWEGIQVAVNYTTSATAPLLRIQKNLGADAHGTQPFPDLVAESDGKWTAAHRQDGHAKIYLRFDVSALEGSIPDVRCVVQGISHYDPRSGLTEYSANPALAIATYLTNTEWGLGAVYADEIDEDALEAAANLCDESVSLAAGGSELRYRANGAFVTSERPGDILEGLIGAMAGRVAHISDRWHIHAGGYETPTVTLDADELVGAIKTVPMPTRAESANGAKGIYVSPENFWQPTDWPAIEGSAYLAADGGERIWVDLDFTKFCTSGTQTQRLGKVELLRRRNALTFSATFRLTAWRALTGHTVAMDFARYGWSGKVFEILEAAFVVIPGDGDGAPALGVQIVARETAAAIYDWSTSEEQAIDLTPNTSLPDPFARPSPITGLAAASGTAHLLRTGDGTILSRAYITWDDVPQTFIGSGNVEIQYKRGVDAAFTAGGTLPVSARWQYIGPLADGEWYQIRARIVPAGSPPSEWVQILHQVAGKTEPPSVVEGFTIEGTRASWTPVADVDVIGYRIRYQPGTNRSWGDALAMHDGLITDTRWALPVLPFVRATVMIKAVDAVGNESASPAVATAFFDVTLGDPPVANIIETFDRRAAGWPGTLTGGSVIGGDLEADSTVAFWNTNTAARMWNADSTAAFWPADAFEEMTYLDTIRITDRLTGSLITVQAEVEGSPWSIEYRENSAATFWPQDPGAAYWGASAEPFWDQPPWLAWPGSLLAKESFYDFRVITGQGETQGAVRAFTVTVDAPDIEEAFDDVAIGSGGTRLPITRTYRVIKNVQITVQDDGGAAVSGRIVDKSAALGPLIETVNTSGSAVAGTVDARIQGY